MRTCAFMALHEKAVSTRRGLAEVRRLSESMTQSWMDRLPEGLLTVPVVVHIVYHHDQQNIGDEVVVDQIDILNESFRARNPDLSSVPAAFQSRVKDAEIEFRLASVDPFGQPTNGIIRTHTQVETFPIRTPPTPDDTAFYVDQDLKVAGTGSPAWPFSDYMNIWVCDMEMALLGYATPPGFEAWEDGVVVDRQAFGRGENVNPRFNQGRTLVHEVGHWLNLLHLWGPNSTDDDSCSLDDNVEDTPVQAKPNYDTPQFPRISCNNGPHGDMFMNYMDYVDDHAMVMFSTGQVARMRATLAGPRSSILQNRAIGIPIETAGNTNRRVKSSRVDSLQFDGVSWNLEETQ